MANKHPYVLTIIDMQYKFVPLAYVEFIDKVTRLVKDAIKDNAFIVVAHYGTTIVQEKCHLESTIWDIMMLLDDYKHKAFVNREHCNKSKVIISAIDKLELKERTIKVCGLYTELCIHDTVNGLAKRLPNGFRIELFLDACFYHSVKGLNEALSNFEEIDNVSVIGNVPNKYDRANWMVLSGAVVVMIIGLFVCWFVLDRTSWMVLSEAVIGMIVGLLVCWFVGLFWIAQKLIYLH